MTNQDPNSVNKLIEIIDVAVQRRPAGVSELIGYFGHPDKAIRWASWVAVATYGETALEELYPLRNHSNRNVRWSYVEALGKIRTKRCVASLVDALYDSQPIVRREAVEALGKIGDPSSLPNILAVLDDGSVEVRRHAIGALSRYRDRTMVGPLGRSLRDGDSMVRGKAASALITLGRFENPES